MDYEQLIAFFEEQRDHLVTAYHNKFVVIHNSSVVDIFDEYDEAYFCADERFNEGTYIVAHCVSKEEDRAVFRSRASVIS